MYLCMNYPITLALFIYVFIHLFIYYLLNHFLSTEVQFCYHTVSNNLSLSPYLHKHLYLYYKSILYFVLSFKRLFTLLMSYKIICLLMSSEILFLFYQMHRGFGGERMPF